MTSPLDRPRSRSGARSLGLFVALVVVMGSTGLFGGAAGLRLDHADAQPADSGAVARATEALPGQLDAVIARFADLAESATVAAVVTDATGKTLWSAGPERGLLPASTMKVLTAASVLDVIGADGVVQTGAAATAPIGANGVVKGDVVVVGNGDPTLTTDDYRRWIYPSRPASAIEDLADAIVASGVTRITGDLVGDGSRFGPSDSAAGWPQRYFADFDAHRLSALSVDTGRAVTISQSGGQPQVTIDHDPDPTLGATVALARALADRGVVIDKTAKSRVAPQAGVYPLGRVASPDMSEVLGFMLRESDNHMADTLVRTAAMQETGDGSWAAADRRVRVALEELDVPTSGLVVADGSGLSRNNRVTPTQLVTTDVGLTNELGDGWSSMLAVAGESGTLANRLLGTSGQGRLYAKTGTLADVRALVGHVVGPQGARYHFAMMVNEVDEGRRYLASVLGDELTLALTDALDGCRRVRQVSTESSGPDGDAGPNASPTSSSTTTWELPTAIDPGPYLQDSVWRRRCPDD